MLNLRSEFLVGILMRPKKKGMLGLWGFPHIPQDLFMALSLTNMSFCKCEKIDRKEFS